MEDDDFDAAYSAAAAWDEANLATWEKKTDAQKNETDDAWHEAWLATYDSRGRP